jgi:hypothetical protein
VKSPPAVVYKKHSQVIIRQADQGQCAWQLNFYNDRCVMADIPSPDEFKVDDFNDLEHIFD